MQLSYDKAATRTGDARLLTVLSLALIVAVAAILRFVDLSANPGGLYPDEAFEALSAQRLLHGIGLPPVFFADGGGREATFAYVVAAAFRIGGETVVALRAAAAALGVAGVLAIWVLARRFGTIAGLAAAAWAAGALWLVCIDRNGMRNVLVPLLGSLALAGMLTWYRRPGRWMAASAGAITAFATLYTYQPLKLLPFLLVAWLWWLRRVDRPGWNRLRPNLSAFLAAFLSVAAPMVVVAALDPAAYFGRAVGVIAPGPGQSAWDVVVHWLRTLGMFAITGDPNQRHDVDGLPLLGWPVSLVALVGLLRLWRSRTDGSHAIVLLALPVFLLPPLLATEGGSPHFLRSLGLAPPLAVTIGLGVAELASSARRRWGANASHLAVAAAAAAFGLLAAGSASAYLGRPPSARADAYAFDLTALAAAATPDDLVLVGDYDASVVRFLDTGRLPGIASPATGIADPARYARVLALDQATLAATLGNAAARRATIVDRGPDGRPSVWAVATAGAP